MDIKNLLIDANKTYFIDEHQSFIKSTKITGPLLIVNGGNIKLYDDNVLIEEIMDYRPEIFHRLKEISHLYMAVYLMYSKKDFSNDLKILGVLNHITNNIDKLEPYLQHENLKKSDVAELINKIYYFCVLINNHLSRSDTDFIDLNKKITPYLEEFIRISAETAEVSLHNTIQTIKQKFVQETDKTGFNKWDNISVIVLGRSVHRIGDITMQYFGRLTGKEHEQLGGYFETGWKPSEEEKERKKNRKLIFCENIDNEKDANKLLTEHITAEKMGKDIFGKDTRMLYDLLAENAANWLKSRCCGH